MTTRTKLILITLLGLLLRVGYAVWIYEPSLVIYHGGDYTLYRVGAEEILAGDLAFTNSLYLVRPPLFPLMIALLGVQPLAVIAVNLLLATAIIPLTYWIGRGLSLSTGAALIAAGLVALDLTSIKYAGVLVAEPLANLLLAAALLALVRLATVTDTRPILLWGALAGGLIALSALARPAAYLMWVAVGVWLLVVHRRRLLAIVALVVIALPGTQVWEWHNAAVFGNHTYTTISTYNLVYYRAASVLYQATDLEIDAVYTTLAQRVEERLGNDTSGVDAGTRYSHTAATADTQHALTDVALDVFLTYPLYYVLTIPVGLYRFLLATAGFPVWLALVWNSALLVLVVVGLWRLLVRRDWSTLLLIVFICGYFLAGTLVVQTSGIDSRARSMMTPLLAVAAAVALRPPQESVSSPDVLSSSD